MFFEMEMEHPEKSLENHGKYDSSGHNLWKKKTKKPSEDPENPWFSAALKGMFRP
jgi:hypothetical protein